ncbi:hypothetical protein QF026_007229 [Streptomyces aurantiacus]|nr:hypothetical protein [Streptomyces aurantiacus]
MTVAGYSLPSPVAISVMSPHHTRSGVSAVKSRRPKSANAGRLPGRGSPPRRRIFRPARPISAMRRATVFAETRQPARIRRSQISENRRRRRVLKDQLDRVGQLSSPHLTSGGGLVASLAEPGLRHSQNPTGQAVRDVVLGPLATDERGQGGRVRFGHFTRRTMHGLRTSRSISSSRIRLFFSAASRRSRSSSARSASRAARPVRARQAGWTTPTRCAATATPGCAACRNAHRAPRRPPGSPCPSRSQCVQHPTKLRHVHPLLGPHEPQLPLRSRTPRYEGRDTCGSAASPEAPKCNRQLIPAP